MTGFSLAPQPKQTIESTPSSVFAAKVSRTDPIMVTLDAYGETHEWGPVTWLGDGIPARGDRCLALRDDYGAVWAAPDGVAFGDLVGRVTSLESGRFDGLSVGNPGVASVSGSLLLDNPAGNAAIRLRRAAGTGVQIRTPNTEANGLDLVGDDGSAGAFLQIREMAADPAAPAASRVRLFSRDDGAGKTQLCAIMATGDVIVLGTEATPMRVQSDINLLAAQPVAAHAVQGDVSGTYAFQGSALSASAHVLHSGLNARVIFAFLNVVWTPGATGCGVELVKMDDGPTNITQIHEFTGSAAATPINSTQDITTALQTIVNGTAAGTPGSSGYKSLGYRTKGNGSVGPLLYKVCVSVLWGV